MTAIGTIRQALLVGTALLASAPAWAQTAAVAPGETSDPAAPVDEIVVTGSRIERSGFTTPAPTTVLGAEDLAKRGFTNIGQIANSIPAFQATTTPATTSLNSARAGGSYKADYDLGGVTAFAQVSYAHTSGKANVLPASNFGSIVIQQDNAFLDPGLRTRLLAAGATSFNIARFNLDFGLLTSEVRNDTTRVVAGLEGRFAESWKWNVYGQYGHTLSNVDRGNTANVALFNRSVDAVATPGGPACRVNADADPSNNDSACVPVNLFGLGSPSQAALDYFLGTSVFGAELDQYIVAGSATGELFQLGSRAVSVALGAEYRTTDLTGVADPVSQVNGFVPRGDATPQDVIRHMAHAVNVCGEDHVGVGTDGQLTTKTITDAVRATQLQLYRDRTAQGIAAPGEQPGVFNIVAPWNSPRRFQLLAEALDRARWPTGRIEKVLGANLLRLYRDVWGA